MSLPQNGSFHRIDERLDLGELVSRHNRILLGLTICLTDLKSLGSGASSIFQSFELRRDDMGTGASKLYFLHGLRSIRELSFDSRKSAL